MMNKVITTIAIVALLSVSTSSHALFGNSNKDDSYALKVAKAGKINEGLRDVDEHELNKIFSNGEGTPIISGTLGVGYAAGVFDSPPIGTAGLASVTFLWDAFLRDHTKDSQYTQILAWMPKELAADKKTAASILNKNLIEAISSSAPDNYELSEPKTAKELYNNPKASDLKMIRIYGDQCQDMPCAVSYDGVNYDNKYKKALLPKSKVAPEFIGGYESWFWGNRVLKIDFLKAKSDFEEVPIKEFNYEFYQEVSSKLPKWAYIYVAPNQYKPVPAIFNQGKMYLFSKPAQQAKAE